MISSQHHLTPLLVRAGAMALAAGVDLELPGTAAYGDRLLEAIDAGLVDEALLDAAVARVLRAKFRLGLFEDPYVVAPSEAEMAALEAEEMAAAQELARRSLVLVENDGILPLAESIRRLAALDVEYLLTGHGEIVAGREEVRKNFAEIEKTWFPYLR